MLYPAPRRKAQLSSQRWPHVSPGQPGKGCPGRTPGSGVQHPGGLRSAALMCPHGPGCCWQRPCAEGTGTQCALHGEDMHPVLRGSASTVR